MMYPLPNPRISHTDARLFMNMVQIRLKSQDSRIPGFQLDLKIVYEFQLWPGAPKYFKVYPIRFKMSP
jgi:hypothetical protein